MESHYPFVLEPLPYAYDALEPYIDARTVEIHHNRHLGTYVKKLNAILENCPAYQCWSLERLIRQNGMLPCSIQTNVFNNAGGIYNHDFYFRILTPEKTQPHGLLLKAIEKNFCSFENFKEELTKTALDVFGSGYAWLRTEPNGTLKICKSANQETDLQLCGSKLLLIDVWEHAYYLKYQNRRDEYVQAIFNLFDWDMTEELYQNCLKLLR